MEMEAVPTTNRFRDISFTISFPFAYAFACLGAFSNLFINGIIGLSPYIYWYEKKMSFNCRDCLRAGGMNWFRARFLELAI